MSNQTSLKKLIISSFFSRHLKFVIGAVAIVAIAVVMFILKKDNITNVDIEDTTNNGIENSMASDSNWLKEANAKVESNEQIIYIAPEDLYADDNVVISVTSHVDSQLYGQGIRFDYKNKSLKDVLITIVPEKVNETLDSNKTIVEPGKIKTHVLYIGLESEPFTEGNYVFSITVGERNYKTKSITINTK